jgi:hypothetical protein
MLCYWYVLCAAGGDEGSHSNCSGLNFKWARWTLLGQATTCGPAAPGPIWPSTGLDDSSRMPCEPRGQYKSGLRTRSHCCSPVSGDKGKMRLAMALA